MAGTVVTGNGEIHGLGRVPSPEDPRDGLYTARARFGDDVETPKRKHRKWYSENFRMDQGRIGQCTMASAAQLVAAGPKTQRPFTYRGMAAPFDTVQAYCRAQQRDRDSYGWTQPTYCQNPGAGDNGATMRSAAQELRAMEYAENFWWMQTIDEVVAYLANVGPVWLGTWWLSGMDRMDADKFVSATGQRRGGHAYLLDEIALTSEYAWVLNSWGRGWGHDGRARIRLVDVERLLRDGGEAIGITELRKGA